MGQIQIETKKTFPMTIPQDESFPMIIPITLIEREKLDNFQIGTYLENT